MISSSRVSIEKLRTVRSRIFQESYLLILEPKRWQSQTFQKSFDIWCNFKLKIIPLCNLSHYTFPSARAWNCPQFCRRLGLWNSSFWSWYQTAGSHNNPRVVTINVFPSEPNTYFYLKVGFISSIRDSMGKRSIYGRWFFYFVSFRCFDIFSWPPYENQKLPIPLKHLEWTSIHPWLDVWFLASGSPAIFSVSFAGNDSIKCFCFKTIASSCCHFWTSRKFIDVWFISLFKPKLSAKLYLTSTILISIDNFSFVEENSVDFSEKILKCW